MFNTIVNHLNIMPSTTHASSTYAWSAFGVFGSNVFKERHHYIQSCVFAACRCSRLALPILGNDTDLISTPRPGVNSVVKASRLSIYTVWQGNLCGILPFFRCILFRSKKVSEAVSRRLLKISDVVEVGRCQLMALAGPKEFTPRLPGHRILIDQIAIRRKRKRRS